MPKALLIAEKPDLMRKIEEVYKKNKSKIPYDIYFTSQRGHLVTLLSPTEMDEDLAKWEWDSLPIEPETYGGWKYKIIEEKKEKNFLTSKERFIEIKKQIESGKYDFVIHAGDPDQEGELLVNIVLRHLKNKLPVKRFWTNDLTESHIVNALKNLKDDDNDAMLTNLMDAAYARQHSDWRFGMNISRAATLKMGQRISCGRVKTPILAIVCKREEEIRNFKSSTCYGIKALYSENFDGTYFDKSSIQNDENASEDQRLGIVWFDTKEAAEKVIQSLGKKAEVKQFISKRTETYAPKLYKLATIQIDAGKKGYNDKVTLDAIQKLYENEYLSYPRTDCEYLSSDEDFEGILEAIGDLEEYDSYCSKVNSSDISRVKSSKKWINDKALQESGHSALRPTTNVPDKKTLAKFSSAERDIYKMIVERFIAIFLPPVIQDKTMLIADIDGKTFQSTGKTLVDPGYSVIFGTTYTDMIIPEHKKGDIIDVDDFKITEKTTTCPKRYTSPDLIAVCENPAKFLDDKSLKALGKKLKIGTPATRSGIIRQLIDKDKYIEEKKEKKTTYLYPTAIGEAIINNMNDLAICRVDMTGQWEEELELIRNGQKDLSTLESEMRENVRNMVREIQDKKMNRIGKGKENKVVGVCPKCGKDVLENEQGYICTGYKDGCKIGIFKEAFGEIFEFKDFEELAKGNTVQKGMRGFFYDFDKNKLVEASVKSEMLCPCCSKNLNETPKRYFCECGFSTGKIIAGHVITKGDFNNLAENSHTDIIEDFISSKSNKFSAELVLKDKKLEFKFPNMNGKETDFLCPCCGKNKLIELDKRYSCDCGFTVWKEIAGRKLEENEIRQLSENKSTDLLNGFVSKNGNKFSCYLVVNKRKKNVIMKFQEK